MRCESKFLNYYPQPCQKPLNHQKNADANLRNAHHSSEISNQVPISCFTMGCANIRPSGKKMCAGHFATGVRVSKRDCRSSSPLFAAQRSHFFPVGTVPAEKFLEPIDITLVKIDKILSFTAAHLARIRRRTRFDIV
jgi:hypothetical protein